MCSHNIELYHHLKLSLILCNDLHAFVAASPLKSLFPNHSPTIKVRVTDATLSKKNKSRLKLIFEDSSATRQGTAWGTDAEGLQPRLLPNKIYLISNYLSKATNKIFNKDPVELQLTNQTRIIEQPDDHNYGIRPVSVITDVLRDRDLHTITTLITNIGQIEITPLRKMSLRKIKIVDVSKQEAILCLFKNLAENFDYQIGSSIKITDVRADKDCNINTTASSVISEHQPGIIVDNFVVCRNSESQISLAELNSQISTLDSGLYNITDELVIGAYASSQPYTYIGCPTKLCRSKLTSNATGILLCKSHGPVTSAALYYKISMQLMDSHHNDLWLPFFDNNMARFTETSATDFAALPNNAQHQILRNICGSRVKITLRLTQRPPHNNLNIASLHLIE